MPKHITGLSEQQEHAIQLLVYNDMSIDEIAKEVGVNRTNLWKWRAKNEEFREALSKERKNKFYIYQDVAQKELMKLITDDSDKRTQLQAIKLVMQEEGYLNDKIQVDAKTTVEFVIGEDNDTNE